MDVLGTCDDVIMLFTVCFVFLIAFFVSFLLLFSYISTFFNNIIYSVPKLALTIIVINIMY